VRQVDPHDPDGNALHIEEQAVVLPGQLDEVATVSQDRDRPPHVPYEDLGDELFLGTLVASRGAIAGTVHHPC
jgi:hypothetical protein